MGGTLLFSGTDIATVATVEDLTEFWSPAGLRGESPTYPGVSGATPVQKPMANQVRSGQITVFGDDLAGTEAAVAAAKAILRLGIPQTVTRRKVTEAGNLDVTQTAMTVDCPERWLSEEACSLLIAVETLDGPWFGASQNISSAAGTQDIDGDLPTHRMTITLAAGAARTVANTTTGHQFTFGTTVPSGGVEVDVEARTATAITGGTDMSQYLSWPKFWPMVLNPGSNVITVSAGSASIDYQPAYQ